MSQHTRSTHTHTHGSDPNHNGLWPESAEALAPRSHETQQLMNLERLATFHIGFPRRCKEMHQRTTKRILRGRPVDYWSSLGCMLVLLMMQIMPLRGVRWRAQNPFRRAISAAPCEMFFSVGLVEDLDAVASASGRRQKNGRKQ